MSEVKKIKEDGTLAGCINTGKPIGPNKCQDCAKHSDYTCGQVKKGEQRK
jgi:hypothetical protein